VSPPTTFQHCQGFARRQIPDRARRPATGL
jgi:hypothetical protein